MSPEELVGEDEWLSAALAAFPKVPAHVTVGPGHDSAVLQLAQGDVVVAKDVLVEGVHFDLATCTPGQAARKAVAVNLSDLAACGALPLGYLVGGVLPAPADRRLFDLLMRGFADASREFAVPCLGGDTNVAPGPLVLSVTVLGHPGPHGLVHRSGARPGQQLSVTGPLGGSLGGRHLACNPRLEASQALLAASIPAAMMDLSDGLSRDLPRLCRMSGVGAVLLASAIPVHADVTVGDSLSAALHDGEDFELLLAHDVLSDEQWQQLSEANVTLHTIGEVLPEAQGVQIERNGTRSALAPRGFDHFSRPD